MIVPLTNEYSRVLQWLNATKKRGPDEFGATNFSAGIQLGVSELAGLTGSKSTAREDAKRIFLFLKDGKPAFPFGC